MFLLIDCVLEYYTCYWSIEICHCLFACSVVPEHLGDATVISILENCLKLRFLNLQAHSLTDEALIKGVSTFIVKVFILWKSL